MALRIALHVMMWKAGRPTVTSRAYACLYNEYYNIPMRGMSRARQRIMMEETVTPAASLSTSAIAASSSTSTGPCEQECLGAQRRARKRRRSLCGHCGKWVYNSTYYRHRDIYYDCVSKSWRTSSNFNQESQCPLAADTDEICEASENTDGAVEYHCHEIALNSNIQQSEGSGRGGVCMIVYKLCVYNNRV